MFAPRIAKAQTRAAPPAPRRPAVPASARPVIGNQSALRRAGHPARAAVQARLSVGPVDDPLEHEADRVADQVMRMPDPALAIGAAAVQVSRKCAACAEEETGTVQTRRAAPDQAAPHQAAPHQAPDSVDAALRGPGRPLDPAARAFFEPRFGRDFSAIRIHTDAVAARSARDIGARAYTVGNRIVFAEGALAPHQPAGRHLLAHELAHTAQQDAAPKAVRRQSQPAAQTPPQQIEAARAAAWGRVFNAVQKVEGIGPPPPPGREDGSAEMRAEARRLAVRLFSWDPPNMDQISDILHQMAQALTPGLKTTIAPASDPQCTGRAGYVVDHTPPVVLCPAFFASSAEEKIRTLVHEAAHIAGIGKPAGESYCGVYDCQTDCGGFNSADAWSHYVHCLSGQTPDKPMQVGGGAGSGGHP